MQPIGDGALEKIGVEIEEELLEDEKQGGQLYNQRTNERHCIVMILIWMVLGHSATKELKGGNWWHAIFLCNSHFSLYYFSREHDLFEMT